MWFLVIFSITYIIVAMGIWWVSCWAMENIKEALKLFFMSLFLFTLYVFLNFLFY